MFRLSQRPGRVQCREVVSGMSSQPQNGLFGAATVLLVIVFTSATALSIKCSADLLGLSDHFPDWFVPSFVIGIAGLLGLSATMVFRTWQYRRSVRWAHGPAALAIWILLPLSFVCTSAVHGFYPFRPASLSQFMELDPFLKFNMGMSLFGFVAAASCGVLYARGRRHAAVLGLLGSAVVLLVPNDACGNAFNYWWLATIGASPLMFVPNLFAIMFGTAALIGVHRRLNMLALGGTGMAVAFLGLGHMFRVIW